MSEFSMGVRLFLKAYPWRRIEPTPWARLAKPVSESRLALISTAGFVLPDQAPFDSSVRGGDFSFREIPGDTDPRILREAHRSESFDHTGIQEDPNLGFPLDRVRELTEMGAVGSLTSKHYSFMGSITAPGRLTRDTAPEVARRLAGDGAEMALLIPV